MRYSLGPKIKIFNLVLDPKHNREFFNLFRDTYAFFVSCARALCDPRAISVPALDPPTITLITAKVSLPSKLAFTKTIAKALHENFENLKSRALHMRDRGIISAAVAVRREQAAIAFSRAAASATSADTRTGADAEVGAGAGAGARPR